MNVQTSVVTAVLTITPVMFRGIDALRFVCQEPFYPTLAVSICKTHDAVPQNSIYYITKGGQKWSLNHDVAVYFSAFLLILKKIII